MERKPGGYTAGLFSFRVSGIDSRRDTEPKRIHNGMKKSVKAREIKYVWHFTRLGNLESIIEHGLISRKKAECLTEPPTFNDSYRLDGEEAAICCSISHPNYKMFWGLRKENPDEEWIVLACKPKILWKMDCAFCVENAASKEVTCIPIADRKGDVAFEKMFDEIDGKPSRKELDLPAKCPTNPQAEVLVFDDIQKKYLIAAICQTKKQAKELANEYKKFDFGYTQALFSARKDYKHWQ